MSDVDKLEVALRQEYGGPKAAEDLLEVVLPLLRSEERKRRSLERELALANAALRAADEPETRESWNRWRREHKEALENAWRKG